MTSGKRWRRARSASVNRWTGIATSMGKETFVTLHEYQGGKGYYLLHKSCRLLARPDVFFHTGGSDADVGLSPRLERYLGCDPPALGHFGVRSARTACGG